MLDKMSRIEIIFRSVINKKSSELSKIIEIT